MGEIVSARNALAKQSLRAEKVVRGGVELTNPRNSSKFDCMSQTLSAEPRWRAVGLVIDQNTRDLLANRYGLIHETISWFKAIELFRAAEMEAMIEREPTASDLRQHKTWLAQLIAEGERLVTEIRTCGGLPRNQARIKPSDVEATVEELRTTQAQWHGQMTKQRKAELWEGIFHVSPPRS